jgi:hypothetical protein
MVIACYRPKEGKETRLLELVKEHVPILRSEGLATERTPVVMRAGDGTILEVFEWVSAEAVKNAHTNETVKKMWERFAEACTYESLASLKEAKEMFAHFEPVNL